MRQFAPLSVKEAQQIILQDVVPLSQESCVLENAGGRVLAEDLKSLLTQPPFDSSSMDGYAVHSQDLVTIPLTLKQIGEAAAGHPYHGSIASGETVRIFTGAKVPHGADTVIIQENTEVKGDQVTLLCGEVAECYIRPKGYDFHEGQSVIQAGTCLDFRTISLAASMNHNELKVRKKPHVAVIATGDELLPPGSLLGPGQIISSIPSGLKTLIEKFGATAEFMGIAKDNVGHLIALIEKSNHADIIITIGGASVGDHDHVHTALQQVGTNLSFWKIAMRPGKPLIHGRLNHQYILGLPGNPVSSFVCGLVFLVPLIEALLGRKESGITKTRAQLLSAVSKNGPREHYMRAKYEISDKGCFRTRPLEDQDSSLMSRLNEANCLLVRPPHDQERFQGEYVSLLIF